MEEKDIVYNVIPEHSKYNVLLMGEGTYRYSDIGEEENFQLDYERFLHDFNNKKYKVIIGTTVLDEGFDIPSLGALILGGTGSKIRRTKQRLGRVLRKKEGINRTYIVDFMDNTHIFLKSQSNKRNKLYTELEITKCMSELEFMNYIIIHRGKLNARLE